MALGVLALGGCKAFPPPVPLAQLNEQQTHGHAVYQARCVVCHADRTNAAVRGPALRSMFKKEYLASGAPATDQQVMATIVRGRGNMPAVGRLLTEDDLEDLMAYLHTL